MAVLGKIDSSIVEQFTIIKGPYSALYGPGLSFYDVESKSWVVEPGEIEVLIGNSSRNIMLKQSFIMG